MNNINIIDLILGSDAEESEEIEELFHELFDNKNNRELYNDKDLSDSYLKAIDCLFEDGSIEERIDNAIISCYWCFEAYYFYKLMIDDVELYNFIDTCLLNSFGENRFKDSSEYEKMAASLLYEDISSLYMFHENYHKAVTSMYTQMEIDGSSFNIIKIKLFLSFARLEDYNSFKRFYDSDLFDDPVSYILYLSVLIKSLKLLDIDETLRDMFHDFPETYDYILASNKGEKIVVDDEIILAFDVARNIIENIPNFFSILTNVIEKENIRPTTLEN